MARTPRRYPAIPFLLTLAASATVVTPALPVRAQEQTTTDALTTEAFLRPPEEIAQAVLAPRYLNVSLGNPSPDGRFFVQEQGDGPPSMASFAEPFYRLAGLQIDWEANRARQLSTRSGAGLQLTDAATGRTTAIQVPDSARVSGPTWSPDGSRLAFFAHFEDETHIFVADPATDDRGRSAGLPCWRPCSPPSRGRLIRGRS